MILKTIHTTVQTLKCVRFLGSCTEDSIKGIVGRRNRGSWCWKMERTNTPDIAEYSLRDKCGRVKSKSAAGPSSCGRLKSECWYQGCKP